VRQAHNYKHYSVNSVTSTDLGTKYTEKAADINHTLD